MSVSACRIWSSWEPQGPPTGPGLSWSTTPPAGSCLPMWMMTALSSMGVISVRICLWEQLKGLFNVFLVFFKLRIVSFKRSLLQRGFSLLYLDSKKLGSGEMRLLVERDYRLGRVRRRIWTLSAPGQHVVGYCIPDLRHIPGTIGGSYYKSKQIVNWATFGFRVCMTVYLLL